MALSANTVFEVRTGGADTNGGGFVSSASGSDYSQQNAAQFSGTDLVIDAVTNTKVTSATHNFVATDVGNLINISAGTGFTAGIFEIVSVASNAATLDRSAGTLGSTGGTWAEGGALASLGKAAGAAAVAGQIIWVKSGTYSVTTTSSNVAAGVASMQARQYWQGYQTTRGDLTGTKPVLQASGITSAVLITGTTDGAIVNITADGNSQSGMSGFSAPAFGALVYCDAVNCPGTGITTNSNGKALFSSAKSCGTGWTCGGSFYYACVAASNSSVGFSQNGDGLIMSHCLSYANGGAGYGLANRWALESCVAYGNTGPGFNQTGSVGCVYSNCIAEANTTYGLETNSSAPNTELWNCAFYNNTTAAIHGTPLINVGQITGSGSFFTSAASGDFSLNNTAGAGALLRGTGLPQLFPLGLTASAPNIGASDGTPGGGGSTGEFSYVFMG